MLDIEQQLLNASTTQDVTSVVSDITSTVSGVDIEVEFGKLIDISCTSRTSTCNPSKGGVQIERKNSGGTGSTMAFPATHSTHGNGFVIAKHESVAVGNTIVQPTSGSDFGVVKTLGGSKCDCAFVKINSGKSVDSKIWLLEATMTYPINNRVSASSQVDGTFLSSSVVDDENHMTLTVYAVDNLKSIWVRLGIQEIGMGHVYDTGIVLDLKRDYKSDDGYLITGIIHEQKEKMIDDSKTTASVTNVKCNENSNSKSCYSFDVYFTLNAPLKHDVVLIGAVDEKRRVQTTYVNDGVEFTGESLLEPDVKELWHDKEWITLTQDDRRYNTWTDDNGYKWEENSFGTFIQKTFPEFYRYQDDTSMVMTRINSNFEKIIEYEKDRAVLVFNSSKIVGILDR